MSLITFNIHADRSDIRKLLSHQKFIIEQLLQIKQDMAKTKQDFDALSERLNASHTNISESLTNLADDVRRLTEGMTPTGGLTEAEATEVFDALNQKAEQIESVANQIRALADQTPEPTEPEPTPE